MRTPHRLSTARQTEEGSAGVFASLGAWWLASLEAFATLG